MPVIQALKDLLAHPQTRGLSIDDPRTTTQRRRIIQDNRFLWRIYDEWYRQLAACLPPGADPVLELGSGAGFFREYEKSLITSEVFACPDVDVVLDARGLPFAQGALRAIAMVDVLHHIPDVRPFLREALRCLRPGGAVLMLEPWVSAWSTLVFTRLHHEPFEPGSPRWEFPASGPLSGANVALPWIVFQRDRRQFEAEFPELEIRQVRPLMPLRYLISGGVSMRQLMPEATFRFWQALDAALSKWPDRWPMFVLIHLVRR